MELPCGSVVETLSSSNLWLRNDSNDSFPLHFAVHPQSCPNVWQEVLLETYATKYLGQALGGGRQWRGELSETTDVSSNKVYRATRRLALPPGFLLYSVYRCGRTSRFEGFSALVATCAMS